MASTWLASGNLEAASGFRLRQERAVQPTQYVRATYADTLPRENRRHVIRFEVTRIHASVGAAEAYILDHPDSLPSSGTLLIQDNASSNSRWIEDAALGDVELVFYAGLTTRWAYTLYGGETLSSDPDA